MVLSLSLYSSQFPYGGSNYHFTHHSLPGGTHTIPILITVSLVVLRLSLCSSHITNFLAILRLSVYSSQSPWWYSDYLFTHHSLPDGTQTIPIRITISLVELRLSKYPSQTPSWYSDYPYTHQSLPGGTQTIPIHITLSMVLLRLSLYSSKSPWWLRLSLYSSVSLILFWTIHHSLPGGTRTIPILIIVPLVVLELSLYPSKSPWWYSD